MSERTSGRRAVEEAGGLVEKKMKKFSIHAIQYGIVRGRRSSTQIAGLLPGVDSFPAGIGLFRGCPVGSVRRNANQDIDTDGFTSFDGRLESPFAESELSGGVHFVGKALIDLEV